MREASLIKPFESQKLKVRFAGIVEVDPMSKPDETLCLERAQMHVNVIVNRSEGATCIYVSTLCNVCT